MSCQNTVLRIFSKEAVAKVCTEIGFSELSIIATGGHSTIQSTKRYQHATMKRMKSVDAAYYPKPLEIICYHCQQAAEKAIKTLVMYYGEEGGMPKLHDLSLLLNQN